MRKFLTALVVLPLALLLVVFAVANRHFTTVSFDPFNSTAPAASLTLPLFALIIASAVLGVIAGSMATWFRQGRWRRAARQHEADARRVRAELADLRAHAATASQEPVRQLPALSGSLYAPGERDKSGATL